MKYKGNSKIGNRKIEQDNNTIQQEELTANTFGTTEAEILEKRAWLQATLPPLMVNSEENSKRNGYLGWANFKVGLQKSNKVIVLKMLRPTNSRALR